MCLPGLVPGSAAATHDAIPAIPYHRCDAGPGDEDYALSCADVAFASDKRAPIGGTSGTGASQLSLDDNA